MLTFTVEVGDNTSSLSSLESGNVFSTGLTTSRYNEKVIVEFAAPINYKYIKIIP